MNRVSRRQLVAGLAALSGAACAGRRHGTAVAAPPGPDPIPDLVTFTPQTSVARSAGPFTSNTVTPAGYDTPATVTVDSGFQASINGGSFSATPGTISPGQTLAMKLLVSSALYSTPISGIAYFNGTPVGSFSVTTLSDPALAYVAPGASWNGTAKSGGTPPADPTRTTAKPAVHWVVPSGRRLTGAEDRIIGVDADANGAAGGGLFGVKQVDFWVEGTVQTVSTPQFLTWSENGVSKTCWGYFIKLRQSDFSAHLTGEARIYATAVPNDTTMQSRVIGFDLVSGGAYDGNHPMSIFPRSAENDWTATVAPSGADYTTVRAAIDAAASALAEAPLITVTTTMAVEATNAASNYTGGKGFCTITHGVGVVATIGRAATYFADDGGLLNAWKPGWQGIEFRGSGIVFDQRNWTSLTQDAGGHCWFNGMKVTNSIGTRDTYYFNGNMHPGFGTGGTGNNTGAWWDGCTIEYQTSHSFPGTGVANMFYVMNCNLHYMASSQFSATHYLYNVYVRDISTDVIRNPLPALSISYSGAAATATISKDVGDIGPNQPDGTGHVTVKIAGNADVVIPFGSKRDVTVYTADTLATALNAIPGVTATVLNSRGGMTIRAFNQVASAVVAFSNIDIKGAPFAPNWAIDSHASWWQAFSGNPSTDRQNVIIRNTTTREYGNLGGAWFETGVRNFGETTHLQDFIVKGNVCQMIDPNADGTQFCFSSVQVQHAVFENNTTNVYAIRDSLGGANDVVYCSMKNNIVGYEVDSTSADPPTGWTNTVPWFNNFYGPGRFGSINGDPPGSSGNVEYNTYPTVITPVWKALLRDPDNGDYRPPASGGSLRGNLFPKINTYDGSGTAYSATDVAGALSKNAPAPSWPF